MAENTKKYAALSAPLYCLSGCEGSWLMTKELLHLLLFVSLISSCLELLRNAFFPVLWSLGWGVGLQAAQALLRGPAHPLSQRRQICYL